VSGQLLDKMETVGRVRRVVGVITVDVGLSVLKILPANVLHIFQVHRLVVIAKSD